MAEEIAYPSFDDFVKRGRNLERSLITVERKKAPYAFDENDVVEYKVGEEKTYAGLLGEVERLRKVVAATYYSERLSSGKEAPLPPSFVERKKIEKGAEKREKPVERKAERKEIKVEKKEVRVEKKEVDFNAVLEEIGSMDDGLLAEYAKKNASDVYNNFNMGGMTAAEFRRKVRKLMAKKAGVPDKKIDEWGIKW